VDVWTWDVDVDFGCGGVKPVGRVVRGLSVCEVGFTVAEKVVLIF